VNSFLYQIQYKGFFQRDHPIYHVNFSTYLSVWEVTEFSSTLHYRYYYKKIKYLRSMRACDYRLHSAISRDFFSSYLNYVHCTVSTG